MEIRTIDKKPFVALKQGKHEVVKPPEEVIAGAQKRVADAKTMLTSLAISRAEQQARLEDVLLGGGSTAGARKELATITELEADQVSEIDDANRDIEEVTRLIDDHRAEQLEQADTAAIVKLCKPLDNFLKDHQ